MIKWLIKATVIGITAYLIIKFPGTVANHAADAVTYIRDGATALFHQIG